MSTECKTEMSDKQKEKYQAIRKVICLMIHCVDCDDEECFFMPYCLDFQDLLIHQEECVDKRCKLRVNIFRIFFSKIFKNYF